MVFEEDYLDDSVTIIRIPGETGPRGPRGFPLVILGALNDPSDLSGQYQILDGEDFAVVDGLQPGDAGYAEPVIGQAYVISQDLWVYTPEFYWINTGPIRATVEVGDTTVLNPDELPNVRDVGDGFDTVLEFDIPRAAVVSLGAVTVVNPDEQPEVYFDGEDGDVVVGFDLPRSPDFAVDQVDIVDNDQQPDVSLNIINGDVGFEFELPRAKTLDLGSVTVVNPDQQPTISDSGDVNSAVLDFELPRAANVSLGDVNVVNPDTPPDVVFSGDDGDVVVGFDVPRAPIFAIGEVTVGESPSDIDVTDVGVDGDIELDIRLPRTTIDVGNTTIINPNENPLVTNSGTTSEAVLDFDLPRASRVELGAVNVVNPDVQPDVVFFDGEDGDVSIDFDVPRSPTFSVGTVTLLSEENDPFVTNVGTDGDIVLNFGIVAGPAGAGIPAVGQPGQVLIVDPLSVSTEWSYIDGGAPGTVYN